MWLKPSSIGVLIGGSLDEELTYHATKLKGQYRIAYADCFVVALSMQMKASIVTGDPEFKRLTEKVNILWIS